jgi:hypothetical protein
MSAQANANPTKSFFISLIVRDVNITDCIKDLIDNSIDGIVRHHSGQNLKRFKILLKVTEKEFEIWDNCGGIELDIAKRYAFRFGKPDDEVERDKLIAGRYGIGMKRAIFKLGDKINIATQALKSSFSMQIDVPTWKRDDTPPWKFDIQTAEENDPAPMDKTFTRIRITGLHEEVADEFGDSLFRSRLIRDLEFAYADRIRHGLTLKVNDTEAKPQKMELLSSSKVKAMARYSPLDGVRMKCFVGLGPDDDDESSAMDSAGWYVFCNNRLLLAADKSPNTGWGRENKNPSWHPQYNQFRGYVFFESNNTDKLPWNTAKNQLNTESAAYRTAKPMLADALREVVDYLNKRKKARSDKDRRYDEPLKSAKLVSVWDLPAAQHFRVSVRKNVEKRKVERISYERPSWMVERAMETLGVSTPKEVGEETFDHYFERNCNGQHSR